MLPAKKLDEQCFYDLTCLHNDENSECKQINHNAICQCKDGFHEVTHSKPTRRTFCTQGNSDLMKVAMASCVIDSSGRKGIESFIT